MVAPELPISNYSVTFTELSSCSRDACSLVGRGFGVWFVSPLAAAMQRSVVDMKAVASPKWSQSFERFRGDGCLLVRLLFLGQRNEFFDQVSWPCALTLSVLLANFRHSSRCSIVLCFP